MRVIYRVAVNNFKVKLWHFAPPYNGGKREKTRSGSGCSIVIGLEDLQEGVLVFRPRDEVPTKQINAARHHPWEAPQIAETRLVHGRTIHEHEGQ